MLIFLDTELTNLIDREMISIGMVTEDGQYKLYLEVKDFDQSKCNSFVKSAVLPQLGFIDEACMYRVDVQDRLRGWFSMLPRSVTIACDSQVDREVLIREFGGECPNNLSGWFDLRPLIDTGVYHQAVEQYHTEERPWHHAFYDAQAHRAGWLAWMDQRRQKKVKEGS
ncbi:hypothetical protein [Aquitalea aquatilis]|uniref:hypothetical protein n=1 Tax=Aquitalea aquatilis TaxID=1537400 RepID=UPI00143D4E40|nr:hypothetical protein [Aquitalea aquatilis]